MLVESILLGELAKKLEKLSLILLADSISRVLYEDLDILEQLFPLNLSKNLAADLDFASGFRELHSISEEVERNLLKSLWVDVHHHILLLKLMENELHFLVRSHDVLSGQDFSHHRIDVYSFDVLHNFT